jgi:hypothetical protein
MEIHATSGLILHMDKHTSPMPWLVSQKKLHQCVLYFTNTISEDSEARRYHVHQDKQRRRVTKAILQASCVRKGCIATFEPLIQVKSEAVDTGRGFFSRAHAQISEDLVPYGHVVWCGHVLSVRDGEGKFPGSGWQILLTKLA